MARQVRLSLVFHNHQPVGNFDGVFAAATHQAYEPLVALYERHPAVKGAMHFTGPLRAWLLAHQPELLHRVRALVARGQIEPLGGAYYEPILAMLDDADRAGQLQRMNAAVQEDFGQAPTGMWLAERVWEPGLARPIAQAGLRYALLDDTHFNDAGFADAALYGHYITEDGGHPLHLLPASRHLRYLIPAGEVDDVLAYLRGIADAPDAPAQPWLVMGDDGEKFGLWLGSHARCWAQGWMDAFFTALEANADWLTTVLPGAAVRDLPPLGRAYLPTASYIEMNGWAMPADRAAAFGPVRQAYADTPAGPFLRGGHWRHFLVKYPEANHMQKRGLAASRRAHALPPDDPRRARALDLIWASQCNCAYWHGVFGGVYLFHIRAANYAHILAAEDHLLGDGVAVDTGDFDLDGHADVALYARPASLLFSPATGGALLEWDDLPARYNLLNILNRHAEAYHAELKIAAMQGQVITPQDAAWHTDAPGLTRAQQHGLAQAVIVDAYRHGSLIDHILPADATLAAVERGAVPPGDFAAQPYAHTLTQPDSAHAILRLWRTGTVGDAPLCIEKQITLRAGVRGWQVDYRLHNPGEGPLSLRYGLETSYGFDGGDGPLCGIVIGDDGPRLAGGLGLSASETNVSAYRLWTQIRGFQVRATLSEACTLWRYPLAPVGRGDQGFERVHQGVVLLHLFDVHLPPGADWRFSLALHIEAIEMGK